MKVLPAADTAFVQQFTPTSATTWWAVVADNLRPKARVFRTSDSGHTWQNVTPQTGYVGSSSFLNGDDAWIETGAVGQPKSEVVYRTLDGGESWQQVGTVPIDCDLQFVDSQHGWCSLIGAAAGSEAVTLWRTIDGGATWQLASRSAFEDVGASSTPGSLPIGCDKSVSFTSASAGWSPFWCNGGGIPSLYATTDAGSTWHARSAPPRPAAATAASEGYGAGLETPVVQGPNIAVVVTIGRRYGASTAIATSADGGRTWRTQLVPHPSRTWTADLIDPLHWRFTDGTVLMATDDGGSHWRTTTPAVQMHGALRQPLDLKFLTPALGWALNSPNGGPFWWTTDGGATWKRITVPSSVP